MNNNEQYYNNDNQYDIDENDTSNYYNEREEEDEDDDNYNQQRRHVEVVQKQQVQSSKILQQQVQQQHEQQQKKDLETVNNNDNNTPRTFAPASTGGCNNSSNSSISENKSRKGQSQSQHGTTGSSTNNDAIHIHTNRDYNDNINSPSTDIVVRNNTNTIHNHHVFDNHYHTHPTGNNAESSNITNENEHLLGIAFVSFLSFAIIQMIFAFIAQSQSMKGDSAAMLVDSLTYLFNYIAEKLKQRIQQRKQLIKNNETDGIIIVSENDYTSDNDQQSKKERKLLLQLEIIPPLLSVLTLLIITILVLDKALHVLLIDLHNDSLLLQQQLHPNSSSLNTSEIIPQSPSTIPNMSIMLFFSTLNLLLDGVNVFYFAKAKHLMGYTTVSNTDDHDIDHIDIHVDDETDNTIHNDQEAQHQHQLPVDATSTRSDKITHTNTDQRDYNKYRYVSKTTTVTNAGGSSSNPSSNSQWNDYNQEECNAAIPVPADIHSKVTGSCTATTAPPGNTVYYSPKFRKQTLSNSGNNAMTKTTTSTNISTTTTACLSPKRSISAGSAKNSLGVSGVPIKSLSSPASAAIIITRTTTTNKKCATCDTQNRNGMNNSSAGTTIIPTNTLNDISNTGNNTIVEETTTTTTTTMMVSSNLNMCSAYTHVIADTIRSIAVIFAAVTVLVFQPPNVSPEEADSIAAIIVSFVIIGSLLPLLRGLYVSISEYYILCYPIQIQPLIVVVDKSTVEIETNEQTILPISISMQTISSSLYDDKPTVQLATAASLSSSSLQQQQEQSSCDECKYTVV